MSAPTFSAALAALVAKIGAAPPDEVETRIASHCLLDWVSTTVAGSTSEPACILHRLILDEGGREEAPLVGFGGRATARQSALLNGTASHVLDLDDVHLESRVHPSCVVWPAVVALSKRCKATGADAIAAFVAGVEMQSRMGRLIGNTHYGLGWHNTATLGCFGAASAAVRLLRLTDAQHLTALGLAATMAAGLRASFGTMAKPLHAGRAAEAGVQAALLSADGFTSASADPLLAYARMTSANEPKADHLARCLDRTTPSAIRSVIFKYSASCYGTHAPIEAALRLPEPPDDGDTLLVELEPQYMTVCNIAQPRDANEARFSVRSCVALALLRRDMLSTDSFLAATRDGPVVALRDRIEVRAGADIARATARLTLACAGRPPTVILADASRPESDLDRQEGRLKNKARQATGGRLNASGIDALLSAASLWQFAPVFEDLAA